MVTKLVVLATVSILSVFLVLVAVAVVMGILFTQTNGTQLGSDANSSSPGTASPVITTPEFTSQLTSNPVLAGNFTILHRTISSVIENFNDVCNYLAAAVQRAGITYPFNCNIRDIRLPAATVMYQLQFWSVPNVDRQRLLYGASYSIAQSSWSLIPFNIDQSSIVFSVDGSVWFYQNYRISGSNYICMDVVSDVICMCSPGYYGPLYYVAGKPYCFRDYVARFCTPTELPIQKDKICDKYQDCPDDSDEINCICDSQYQYACKNGRCIDGAWLCDGVRDCPQGDDEMYPQCENCNQSQFQCLRPRYCIPSEKQCDGRSDCQDSSDEIGCVSLSLTAGFQLLTVTYRGIPGYKICRDNWDSTWSNRACNIMGFGTATDWGSISSSGLFLSSAPGNTYSNFLDSLTATNCPTQLAIVIKCLPAVCGVRTISGSSVGQYILNGQRALKGAWPWQVFIDVLFASGSLTNGFTCGGTLISDRWILTAAHCTLIPEEERQAYFGFAGKINPQNILVTLGAISLNALSKLVVTVDRVYSHWDYNPANNNNDVALIRLNQSVSFSDTVRPICLPAKNQDLSRLKDCVATGFGRTLRNTGSDDLLQARINILPDDECRRIRPTYINETQLCIGTDPSLGNGLCSGDSGGPLSCQDLTGVWRLIGVTSFGSTPFQDPVTLRCPNTFDARVTAYLDWINSVISANPT